MKEFTARKTYYVHEWSAIKDWLGNRGYSFEREELSEWCYDGHFLYLTFAKGYADYWLLDEEKYDAFPIEKPTDVVVCTFNCEMYECDHILAYEKSPFANKIT